MTNPHLQRALLLLEQSRWQLAEDELRQVLAEEPQNAYAHAMLALSLCEREDLHGATDAISPALHFAPDFPYAHFVHARILSARNRDREALAAAREAVRLDPGDPHFAAMEAGILFDLKQWPEALAAAERGLALDAEDVGCTNLRAMCLQKLGRPMEAGDSLRRALARNPESDVTHANRGWALLEAGKTEEALHHFQEALRLDPNNDWARHGVIESLKSRHTLYTLFLKYAFFMARLSTGAQWGVILGGYVLMRLLRSFADAKPDIAPWIFPVQILYLGFVLLTWTADPLFNLLLRLNRFGRLALSREQVVASNWVGTCVGLALLCLTGAALMDWNADLLVGALIFGGLIIPMAGTFKCPRGWPRRMMTLYTGVMAAAGLARLAIPFAPGVPRTFGTSLLLVFVLGMIGSGWVANILAAQKLRR